MRKISYFILMFLFLFLVSSCGDKSEILINYTREENKIYFGKYPQTRVVATPYNGLSSITFDSSTWTSYKYYLEQEINDYMFYKDVDIDKDGKLDYRGVYFTKYRPYDHLVSSTNENSGQSYNGYLNNKIYWFSYDYIEWDILCEKNGKALIIANLLLDSQEYYPTSNTSSFSHNGDTGYANNYELSNIRKFLNDTFFNTAFNGFKKDLIKEIIVDNGISSTYQEENNYVCNNTKDRLFLLSVSEVVTYYKDIPNRKAIGTDYAKSQGLYVSESSEYFGYSYWWLRSPRHNDSCGAFNVFDGGDIYFEKVYDNYIGVRPACWISL